MCRSKREASFVAALDAQAEDLCVFQAASPEQREIIIQERRAEREAATKAKQRIAWEAAKASEATEVERIRAGSHEEHRLG